MREACIRQPAAFSLVELIVVIFIISLTTALIMPSFWDKGERALRSDAKQIGNTLRYVYDEAVGKKRTYTVTFNLDEAAWGFEGVNESRSFHLGKDIVFKDVIIPSHGEISGGEVSIEFGPLGPDEPVTIHLMKDSKEYTVVFNHLIGRPKIFEGYFIKTGDEEKEAE
jgi:Tfp pilus assembly protein FimT